MRFHFLLAAFFTLTVAGRVAADERGREVVVLYNSRMPESKALADYYATQRNVPQSQVWGFNAPTDEEISRAEFRETIQEPLLKKLVGTKLWRFGAVNHTNPDGTEIHMDGVLVESGIRYAVLCYGMPLKIRNDPSINSPREEAVRPEMRNNAAAVDSELACLPMIKRDLLLNGPLRNPVYTRTNAADFSPTSGVLMVARLDGPTAQIARGLVDKALQAEKEGMWGRAYFDLRNTTDPGLKMGDDWIRGASEICRLLGFETIVDTNAGTFPVAFPMSQIGFYCGWYDPDVSGPFTLPEVEFMPGAFAYHLHSFSASTIRSTTAHWVGPLLAKGATITMGSVYEPYLGGTPNVGIFAARLILQGLTFGEAAYASQNALSWQTTVVGDPLYQPFGQPPRAIHEALMQVHSKMLPWSHLRVVNLGEVKGIPLRELIRYLEDEDITKTSAVLTEKLGDLCAEDGKPASAIEAYQKALALDPSREQRVRLHLTLADKFSAAGNLEGAYQNYVDLLKEWPDYPGNLSLCSTLAGMANQLRKMNDFTNWNEQFKLLSPAAAKSNANTN